MDLNTHKVSFHAVTRYVQRVLDVHVPWAVPPLSPEEIAEAHCLSAETTIEAVRALIWIPAVQLASATGISMVQTRSFGARLSRQGVVATITPPPPRKPRRKLQERSKREERRIINKMNRKAKGRPSAAVERPEERAS